MIQHLDHCFLLMKKQLVNTNSKHTNKKCKKKTKNTIWDFSCIFNPGDFEDFHTLFIVIQQSLHMPHNIT